MFFPSAGIECHPLVPFAAAFAVSFFTSMGGISGAFLLLPFQVSVLGYTAPSVSATNQLFNVVATPLGVWRFAREGRLLKPLVCTIVCGTLPGVFIGALIRIYLMPDKETFSVFAGLVLLYIGGKMLLSLRKKTKKAAPKSAASFPKVENIHRCGSKISYDYDGQNYSFDLPVMLLMAFAVGIAGGAYGVGGGAIISPFIVSLFGLPVHTIAGATLFATCLTSVSAVLYFAGMDFFVPGLNVAPDYTLGLLLGLGGMLGIYLGARCQKYVPDRPIKIVLTAILICTGLSYILR